MQLPLQAETLECQAERATCGATRCDFGEECVAGQCGCAAGTSTHFDSCAEVGKICRGGQCEWPRVFEQCAPSRPGSCPPNHVCGTIPTIGTACVLECVGNNECSNGALCSNVGSGGGCVPSGLFQGFNCQTHAGQVDGGWGPAMNGRTGERCMLLDGMGVPVESPGVGSGICIAARINLANGPRFIPTCANGYQVAGGGCDVPFATTNRFRLCAPALACFLSTQTCQPTCAPTVSACDGGLTCRPAYPDAPLARTHGFCAP